MKSFTYDGRWGEALRCARAAELRELIRDTFHDLVFEPVPHTYSWHGKDLISVSSLIEARYANPFDAVGLSVRCSERDRDNPSGKYYGMSPEAIRAAWEENSQRALDQGHERHAFAERVFNAVFTGRTVEASCPGEEAVLAHWDSFGPDEVPLLAEVPVCVPDLGYAGTFDLLLWRPSADTLLLKDWKTTREIEKSSYGRRLPTPFGDVPDQPKGEYSIQLSAYQVALERTGLMVESRELLQILEDGSGRKYLLDYLGDRLVDDLTDRPL